MTATTDLIRGASGMPSASVTAAAGTSPAVAAAGPSTANNLATAADFRAWMEAVQARVEQALDRFLPPGAEVPTRLHQAMRYTALGGGKRVRPLLVFAAGQLFGADLRVLERAAAAVEMIHVYSLVHDDMPCMDDDDLRRGKPTVHVAYDEATALLVGDALQSQAFLTLAEAEGVPPARLLAMLRLLAHASGPAGMCGGQAIDLASVGLALNREQLEQMHQLKTGALLRASVLLGALAGAELHTTQEQALDAYARAIGLAFQVVDDVLDATADSATLGKTAGKDAADNKPTYVSLLGLDASRELAEALRQAAHQALAPFADSAPEPSATAAVQFEPPIGDQPIGDKSGRLRDLADLIVQRKA